MDDELEYREDLRGISSNWGAAVKKLLKKDKEERELQKLMDLFNQEDDQDLGVA